jgi:formate dehydrogenase subunit delta
MNVQHLVTMANDIGNFFKAEPVRADAVAGIAGHLKRFWDPRMRRQIVAHLRAGGDGMDDLVKEAVAAL